MVRLLLARHGLSTGNVQLVFQGQMDMEIAQEGELQAALLGRRLESEDLSAVYTSDLQRAARTAEIAVAGRMPVVPDGAWREKSWGIWEGLNRDQIVARYPGQWEQRQADPVHWRPTDAESPAEVKARIMDAIQTLEDRHPSETVLVVTHGGVLLLVSAWAYGLPLESPDLRPVSNCGLCSIEWDGGAPEVHFWNDVRHLEDLAATGFEDFRATGFIPSE